MNNLHTEAVWVGIRVHPPIHTCLNAEQTENDEITHSSCIHTMNKKEMLACGNKFCSKRVETTLAHIVYVYAMLHYSPLLFFPLSSSLHTTIRRTVQNCNYSHALEQFQSVDHRPCSWPHTHTLPFIHELPHTLQTRECTIYFVKSIKMSVHFRHQILIIETSISFLVLYI